MNDHFRSLLLKSLFENSDDGFIVVDKNGIVLDINEQYAQMFVKDIDEIIGHPIEETITTTSMYEVLRSRTGDRRSDVHMQNYYYGDVRLSKEVHVASKRFCIFDENQDLLGAAAQMKFVDHTQNIDRKYKELEQSYYEQAYNEELFKKSGFDNMIGNDPAMLHLKSMGIRASQIDFPVLITGETGTGKELMAKSIHLASSRKDMPFIAVNCGAIPDNLLESELFGYEEGAFTGARKSGKPGKFELANGGTFFLDEIGDMPLAMQVKLLRVLQEQEVERIGGSQPIPLDVRIISATRQDLPAMIAAGTFREDLFYRLAVVNLQTVPLRDCPNDILHHAYHHLNRLNRKFKSEVILSELAKQCLQLHKWPGNIRELQNVISSAYAMCDNNMIEPENLPQMIANALPENLRRKPLSPAEQDPHPGACLKEKMNAYELRLIEDALSQAEGNMTDAAKLLGIERSLLYKKMNKYGIR